MDRNVGGAIGKGHLEELLNARNPRQEVLIQRYLSCVLDEETLSLFDKPSLELVKRDGASLATVHETAQPAELLLRCRRDHARVAINKVLPTAIM